jgi:putative ABC transport system ATP-binding protein
MNKQSKSPLISLTDICKTYVTGPVRYQALKGVSFDIEAGEFVAIMGPSGSGKSTLMNIIGALDVASKGKYILNSKDISHYDEDELATIRNREIGFVFQSFNLLARTSVLKNVERPMMYAGVSVAERRRRALESLRAVDLEDKAANLSNHLSGGQIQRVAIARALVMKPSIILADEPTGNLDTKTSKGIMRFLEGLNKQGSTIILITHEKEVAQHAHRLIMLRDGLILSDTKNGKRFK